jgi:hypothetical protein
MLPIKKSDGRRKHGKDAEFAPVDDFVNDRGVFRVCFVALSQRCEKGKDVE